VALVQRVETVAGPVAVDGRTFTMTARAYAIGGSRPGVQWFAIRARPHRVEVLDRDGARRVLPVRDIEELLLAGIALAAAAAVVLARRLPRSRR
jgi:hypothetical protein